ncbi:MAG TPA: cyclic pyranopterin monophosphate synthase MoaC [Gemmatimonadaceae bacterium]|nr:cyclic pyranopterin monophosphate synthase MoaC [Gemmatimonadaceae bacterium]
MTATPPGQLSHVGPDGSARMVNVGNKPETDRMARATGHITMSAATLNAIVGNTIAKGDVLGVARVAGIMAAKRTATLIPLCHPLQLTDVSVALVTDSALPGVRVEATVRSVGRTGVEMEALAAATIALLTVYDMAKAMDKSMVIKEISLAEKSGGAGGPYARG